MHKFSKLKNKVSFVTLLSIFIVPEAFSSDLKYCSDSSPDGITLENDKKRLISVYRQVVSFPDAKGIRKARVIAQERSKGEIVRFFSQNQKSIRSVGEVDTDKTQSTRLVDQSGSSMNSMFTREQSETLTEMDTSIASGNLSGIRQIEEYYDKSNETICVAMGFSAKSAQSAKDAQNWMNGDGTNEQLENKNTPTSHKRSIGDDW